MSQFVLNLDDALLSAAQAYARQQGQELDTLVAALLQSVVTKPEGNPAPQTPTRSLSPRIQRLFGSVKVPDDFDYRTELGNALDERYGL